MTSNFINRAALGVITASFITALSGLAYAAQVKAPLRPPGSERIVVQPGATPESAGVHKHKHRHKKEKQERKPGTKKDKAKATPG